MTNSRKGLTAFAENLARHPICQPWSSTPNNPRHSSPTMLLYLSSYSTGLMRPGQLGSRRYRGWWRTRRAGRYSRTRSGVYNVHVCAESHTCDSAAPQPNPWTGERNKHQVQHRYVRLPLSAWILFSPSDLVEDDVGTSSLRMTLKSLPSDSPNNCSAIIQPEPCRCV